MARKRSRHKKKVLNRNSARNEGLKAFNSDNYEKAIQEWEGLPESFCPLSALAEAHFRLGLKKNAKSAPDYSIIQKHFEQAIKYQPDNLGYLYHLGLTKDRSGNVDEAIEIYRKIRQEKNPFSERAEYSLALALFEKDALTKSFLDKLDPKIAVMFSSISKFKRKPYILPTEAPLFWHALVSFENRDFEKAKTMLKEVLSYDNSYIEKNLAHYYLGTIASHAQDWDKAQKEWETAYTGGLRTKNLSNNLSEILHRKAETLLFANNPQDALNLAQKAQNIKEKEDKNLNKLLAQIHQELGYQEAHANQWQKALSHWENASKLGGNNFRLAYNLALAYEKDGNYLSAAKSWREALRRRPRKVDHPDAMDDEQVALLWQRTGEAYRKANQPEEMIKVFKQAIKRDKDNYALRLSLAKEFLAKGRFKAAENEIERILERNKDYIPALMLMGEIAFNNENWWIRDTAPNYWEKILKQVPEHLQARQAMSEYYRNQAEIAFSWSHFEIAINNLKQALEYQPKYAHTFAMIANCYIQNNRIDDAENYINQALQLAPADENIFGEITHAWIEVGNFERAWDFTYQAEKTLDEVSTEFYLAHAEHLLGEKENEEAFRWVDRAMTKANSDEPVLLMAGEMAAEYDHDFATYYLEKALDTKEQGGQACLLLGMLAHEEGEEKRRNKYWRQAERIAKKTDNEELTERIKVARLMVMGPLGMMQKIVEEGGPEALDEFFNFMDENFNE